MESNKVWTEETRVKTFDTDFQNDWKPAGMLRSLIDAADLHASHLGYDYGDIISKGMVWVLSRVKMHFIEIPKIQEQVVIKTWIKGVQQRLFTLRDFDVRGEDGRPLAAVSFAWVLIDPVSRRLLPPQALGHAEKDYYPVSALEEPLEKLAMPEGLEERFNLEVRYSMVDMLGHANASRYVEWACDCFDPQMYQSKRLEWLQINYIRETKPGEHLSVAAGMDAHNSNLWYIYGKNLEKDASSFEALLTWADRS